MITCGHSSEILQRSTIPASRPCGRRRRQWGAVLVETVACVVFLTIMLAGIIQYTMVLHTMSTLDQYAREGARYTAEHWSDPNFNNTSSTTPGTFANFMQGIATSGNVRYTAISSTWISIPWNSTSKSYDYTNGIQTDISNSTCRSGGCVAMAAGDVFTVYVKYDMTQQYVFFPLVPGLPKPFTYTAKVSMAAY